MEDNYIKWLENISKNDYKDIKLVLNGDYESLEELYKLQIEYSTLTEEEREERERENYYLEQQQLDDRDY